MIDLESMWNFSDPSGSEERFRIAMTSASPDEQVLLQTQIARTFGLRKRFEEAHTLLDGLVCTSPEAVTRWNLEKGRVLRSSGHPNEALPFFKDALRAADEAHLDHLGIDALHMIAIVDEANSVALNLEAIHRAEQSQNPKARKWIGSLCNNLGWSLFDEEKYDSAMEQFKKALAFRLETGDQGPIQVAKWCVARCHRALNQPHDALTIQSTLDPGDGYVQEELALLHHELGHHEEAKVHAARALELTEDFPEFQEAGSLRKQVLVNITNS